MGAFNLEVTDVEQASSPRGVKGPEQPLSILPTKLVKTREEHSQESEATKSVEKASRRDKRRVSITSMGSTIIHKPRSFKMSPKVRIGGAALACCAGTVNAIAFHAIGSFVSHQTGSFSRVGFGDMEALLLVTSFVFGALLCGSLVSHNGNLKVPLYDVCMIIQAGLLVATTLLADHWVARYIAAASCGLQNGLATHWGGAVVRTTHVTGLFTDVGLLTGRLLSLLTTRGCRLDDDDCVAAADDLSKLSVLGSIAIAFLTGIVVGTHCFLSIGHYAFLIPAAAIGSFGCAYLCYRIFGQCFSSKKEAEMDKAIENGDDAVEMDEDVECTDLEAGGNVCPDDASKGSDTPTSCCETREGSGTLPDLERTLSEN